MSSRINNFGSWSFKRYEKTCLFLNVEKSLLLARQLFAFMLFFMTISASLADSKSDNSDVKSIGVITNKVFYSSLTINQSNTNSIDFNKCKDCVDEILKTKLAGEQKMLTFDFFAHPHLHLSNFDKDLGTLNVVPANQGNSDNASISQISDLL